MPRPRFQKLAEEKRHHLLETAAKAFAAHGYEGASLNQILEQAGISKGAAYYYFDDKADIFLTTFHYYFEQLTNLSAYPVEELTAETFWSALKELYRQPYIAAYDKPWVIGLMRAANQMINKTPEHPLIQAYIAPLMNLAVRIIHHGQALGLVRSDLPDDLLLAQVIGFDSASDDWLLRHWGQLPREELEAIAMRVATTLQLIMSPLPDNAD